VSCANAQPIAAVRKAAAHRPTDIGLPISLMPRRFEAKTRNCQQICAAVFDPNQVNSLCHTLNRFP
jgi:hypothetical protein